MHTNNEIDHSKKRKRVIDNLSYAKNNRNWNSGNAYWSKMMLIYDKKFTTVEACIHYDAALAKDDRQEILFYRDKIYAIVDEAYKNFSDELLEEPYIDCQTDC